MIWCWKNTVNIMEGIGITNVFLKIAPLLESLIGSGDTLSYLILSCRMSDARLSYTNFGQRIFLFTWYFKMAAGEERTGACSSRPCTSKLTVNRLVPSRFANLLRGTLNASREGRRQKPLRASCLANKYI